MSCDHRQLAVSVVLFPGPHRLPLPCRCKDRSISCDHCRLAVSAPQCFKPPCGWFGDWRPSFRSTSLAGPCCVAARLKCGLATRDYFRFPGALPLLMLCRAPTVFVYATGDRFSYRRCFLLAAVCLGPADFFLGLCLCLCCCLFLFARKPLGGDYCRLVISVWHSSRLFTCQHDASDVCLYNSSFASMAVPALCRWENRSVSCAHGRLVSAEHCTPCRYKIYVYIIIVE